MAEIRYPNYKTGQEESIDFIVLNLGYVQLLRDWGNKDISSPFARIYYVRRGNAMLHLPQGDGVAPAAQLIRSLRPGQARAHYGDVCHGMSPFLEEFNESSHLFLKEKV